MPASASQNASVQPNPDDQDAQHDLEKLAAELSTRCFKTVLITGDGRLPCLDVLNPAAPVLSERIYAQADNFWWSWAQVIASRDRPAAAADAIARALRPAARSLPVNEGSGGEPVLADVQRGYRCWRGISCRYYARHADALPEAGAEVTGEDPRDPRDQIRRAEALRTP